MFLLFLLFYKRKLAAFLSPIRLQHNRLFRVISFPYLRLLTFYHLNGTLQRNNLVYIRLESILTRGIFSELKKHQSFKHECNIHICISVNYLETLYALKQKRLQFVHSIHNIELTLSAASAVSCSLKTGLLKPENN